MELESVFKDIERARHVCAEDLLPAAAALTVPDQASVLPALAAAPGAERRTVRFVRSTSSTQPLT